ncbi:hypothetical protein ACIQXW_23275 [Lysinibacillus sp. NPDC097162]|uniref:hypothetical protein n=1 Tax=Lysinibacillus sp. NPDC097162 TaxID=3364140 RepID=UPI00381D57BD
MTQNNQPLSRTIEVTKHAIDRSIERLGFQRATADNNIRQLLAVATFHGIGSSSKCPTEIYLHHKTKTTIVISRKDNCVVTVYRDIEEPSQSKATITIDRISTAIKRELSRMTTQLRREIRKLTEQQAQLNVSIAELTLKKIRCKAPHTQALIQTRIDAIITQVNEIAQEVDAKLTQIKNAEREVSEVISE